MPENVAPRSRRLAVLIASAICWIALTDPTPAAANDVTPLPAAGDIPADFANEGPRKDHVRTEHMIPMRDGVKLYTVVVAPQRASQPMPMVLTRTPYGADRRAHARRNASPLAAMTLHPEDELLVRNGYIRVFQDARGKHRSEGVYVVNRPLRGPLNRSGVDHATDAWDTIDWLVKNVPNNNGKVGVTGFSYDGFLTLMTLFEPHPALAAIVPANAFVDGWLGDDWYHQGALRQTMIEWAYWQSATKQSGKELPLGHYDLYAAFLEAGSAGEFSRRHGADRLPAWRRVLDNPAYTAYWREQALQRLLGRIKLKTPTLTIHGLFDAEDIFGPIASYSTLEKHDARNDINHIVIGPWRHGQHRVEGHGLGKLDWGADTSRWFRENVLQPFWDAHLKGIEPAKMLAPVLAFETGANAWREYDAWPPTDVRPVKLYLQPHGGLAFTTPPEDGGYTEYVSDPAKPVPYQVRPIPRLFSEQSTWSSWLTDDQRPFADRPDVVSFVSAPLAAPLTIAGDVLAALLASTSGEDADWVVKLIDVYPDEHPQQPELGGYQLMISADIFRGRYRESFERGRPIPRGATLPYRIALPHAYHRFGVGHRIMVQIQSSWFPLYDRNPQTFVPNIAWAKPGDYAPATHRIHHSEGAASYVEILVR